MRPGGPARPRVIVFVRMPVPGRAKTRLCPPLSPEQAALCYRGLARDAWSAARKSGADVAAALDAAGSEPDLFWLEPDARWFPQETGDLGARLSGAFARAFAEGVSRVVVVGSDVPELSARDIERAVEALAEHDAVIGPAVDGGYYLLGLRRPCPCLFEGIAWSTGRVLEQTLAAARQEGLSTRLLRPLADIDTFADLRALRERGAPLFTREAFRGLPDDIFDKIPG